MELRQEISAYLSRKYGLEYDAKTETLVTVGGSEAIDLLFRAVIKEGDEVLVPEPSFVCYKPCAVMAGGSAVPIPTSEKDDIMKREDLEEIARVVEKHNLFVLSDEIYSELTYDGKHVSFASIDGMWERTVTVNGFSKAFAMTGWRLGYACGPAPVIKAMTKIHQYGIMCAPTTSQYAAVEAMRSCDDEVEYMRNEYNHRRRIMVNAFREMGLSCFEPLGAFYVFPNISSTGLSSEEFATQLLYEEKVAVVPGTAFGKSGEGFIRCSYAYSIKSIEKALERIASFVERRTKKD